MPEDTDVDLSNDLPEALWKRMCERRERDRANHGYMEGIYNLTRRFKPETIVELGTSVGDSAFSFLCAIEQNKKGHIWTVDINQSLNIKNDADKFGWSDRIDTIASDSAEYAKQWDINKKIDLLYIDTSHEYDLMTRELEGWVQHVNSGGIIIMDDFLTTNAWKAFFDWIQKNRTVPRAITIYLYEYTNPFHTLGIMTKC